jgi:hypothetical protein
MYNNYCYIDISVKLVLKSWIWVKYRKKSHYHVVKCCFFIGQFEFEVWYFQIWYEAQSYISNLRNAPRNDDGDAYHCGISSKSSHKK